MKLRAWFKGRKTLWAARFYFVCGFVLACEPAIEGNLPSLQNIFPWRYWPFLLMGTGIFFEVLRWVTDGPPHCWRDDNGQP